MLGPDQQQLHVQDQVLVAGMRGPDQHQLHVQGQILVIGVRGPDGQQLPRMQGNVLVISVPRWGHEEEMERVAPGFSPGPGCWHAERHARR